MQHGGDGDDALLGAGYANVQIGGGGDDLVIGGGRGNIQFADNLFSALPGDAAMPEGIEAAMDLVDGMFGAEADGDNVMLALGQGNLQIGGAGTDVAIGAAVKGGNVQIGGDGDDVMIGAGQGNAQFGGAGSDFLAGLGTVNVQNGGAGDDVLLGVARGQKAGVQLQYGDEGTDLLLGYAGVAPKKAEADADVDAEEPQVARERVEISDTVSKFAQVFTLAGGDETIAAQAVEIANAYDRVGQIAENIEAAIEDMSPAINVQLGGADGDLALAMGAFAVQAGQAGHDVFWSGGDFNFQFGGEGEDLMLASSGHLNFMFGGEGTDFIVDEMVYAGFLAASLIPQDVIDGVKGLIEAVAAPVEAAAETISGLADDIAALNPLAALEDAVEGVAAEITGSLLDLDDFLDFSGTQYIGGAGDDFLGAGGAGGDLVGGLGDDTYLYTFGFGGTHVVDEAGLDAARNWGELLGLGDGLIDDVTGGAGGADVVELRGWKGLMDLSIDNVAFTVDEGTDLILSYQIAGQEVGSFGSLRLRNMDDAASRVETLRLVSSDGYEEFDLSAAWDAWAEGETFEFEGEAFEGDAASMDFFETRNGDWLETAATGLSNIPFAEEAAGLAQSAVNGLIDFVAPETPDLFALA